MQKASRRVFFVVAVLGLCGIAAAKAYEHLGAAPASWLMDGRGRALRALAMDGAAPAVVAVDGDGRAMSLESFRGRPVLMNFWFSDCEPCRDEMASLDALARALGDRLTVVALSVDPTWEKVRAFHAADPVLRGKTPAYELWLDAKKETPPRFGSFKFPETFLIGRNGELVARFVGPRDWSAPAVLALMKTITGLK